MIRNLVGEGSLQRQTDILVIGAGTAGLVLTAEIASQGRRVICLESGDKNQAEETHPLNAVEQAGTEYSGAEHGRFRCLGGTSTRWGGALIPFQAADPAMADWPVTWEDLAPWLPRVEALFGLPEGPYEDSTILGESQYLARLAKWPKFRNRNVYSLLRDRLNAENGPEIWLNATVTGFRVKRGNLVEVVAQSPDGSRMSVSAKNVVIAAGAIESTRLVLLLDRQNDGCVATASRYLGEGFHDHLSAVVAEVVPKDRAALNRLVGFRFSPGGGMRNLRFELAPDSSLRSQIVPCFAHVGFSHTAGGFSALRDVFRALQRRKFPPLDILGKLVFDMPWLVRAVWWRFLRQRLLYPDDARLELHMVVEQMPRAENRITLSDIQCDPYGQPLTRIEWQVGKEDVVAMEQATAAFGTSWEQGPLAKLAELRFRPSIEIAREMAGGGGIYHPGGTTRMAMSPAGGVVNQDLQVFGIENLRICATSVLPTGGGANPTMMLLLLALRCADKLVASSSD